MTITLTKTKIAIAILAMALMVPATAIATDAWSDVEDGRFYHDAVTWAKANGMTTGCESGTAFCPDRAVTRGENITFAKRYDDLVVQPALSELGDDIDDNTLDIAALMTPIAVAHVDHNGGTPVVTGGPGVSATYDTGTEFYTVTVAGVALSPTTHLVHVTSIRINTGSATEDRSAQTFYASGSVQVSIWDDSSADLLASDFHITIYELAS